MRFIEMDTAPKRFFAGRFCFLPTRFRKLLRSADHATELLSIRIYGLMNLHKKIRRHFRLIEVWVESARDLDEDGKDPNARKRWAIRVGWCRFWYEYLFQKCDLCGKGWSWNEASGCRAGVWHDGRKMTVHFKCHYEKREREVYLTSTPFMEQRGQQS